MSDGAVKEAIDKMRKAPEAHPEMGPLGTPNLEMGTNVPTMEPPPLLDFEIRARVRLAALVTERDEYGRSSQGRVNKLQSDLNQTILECNNGLAGYNAAIQELQTLLGIQPQGYGNAQPGAANGQGDA